MAALEDHPSGSTFKMLLIGNNGGGKTGALAALAHAGYNVRILDLDNGTEILANLLRGTPAAKRVDVESHSDKYSDVGGTMRAKPPLTGFSGAAKVLTNWPGLGKPSEWTKDDVLVVDSLTFLGKFIMNHVLNLSGRLLAGQPPQLQDWGMAMDLQENVLAGLFSLPCNVIVIAHLVNITPEGEAVPMFFPSALGNKLPQKVGGYFNSTLAVRTKGVGANKARVIVTNDATLGCKTPAPGKVKGEYSLETGLADYAKDLFGSLPGERKA